MNDLFKNMPPFEFILLLMGVILFLVLIFLLVLRIIKNRSITILLPFFLFPIIFVAYPTIKSVTIGSFVINTTNSVNDLTKKVSTNPGDTAVVTDLKMAMAKLKNTNGLAQNGKALFAIANAEIAIGSYDSAALYLNKVEKTTPGLVNIDSSRQVLTNKIELRQNFSNDINLLNKEIGQLKSSPDDTSSIHRITQTLANLKVPGYVHPNELITLARSYAVTGNQKQSLSIIQKLSTDSSTGNNQITALKDSIEQHTYQDQFNKRAYKSSVPLTYSLQNEKLLKQTIIR